MSHHFSCPCGYRTHNGKIAHDPVTGCCNCGGLTCMDCVLRRMHDQCEDDCPQCCADGWAPIRPEMCDHCQQPAEWQRGDSYRCWKHHLEFTVTANAPYPIDPQGGPAMTADLSVPQTFDEETT